MLLLNTRFFECGLRIGTGTARLRGPSLNRGLAKCGESYQLLPVLLELEILTCPLVLFPWDMSVNSVIVLRLSCVLCESTRSH